MDLVRCTIHQRDLSSATESSQFCESLLLEGSFQFFLIQLAKLRPSCWIMAEPFAESRARSYVPIPFSYACPLFTDSPRPYTINENAYAILRMWFTINPLYSNHKNTSAKLAPRVLSVKS
jgi:hypothetical protein